jgi:hypothetical protein
MARHVEQILGRKTQTGKRSPRPPLDMNARTGHKGVDVVIWHIEPQSSDGIGGQNAICTPGPGETLVIQAIL